MTRFQSSAQLASALSACLRASIQSPDLCQIEAVHEIIEHEHARGLDGLLEMIAYNPVAFILEAAPGFSRALQRATGHSRERWVAVLP